MVQLSLIQDNQIKKTIIDVPLSQLHLSKYNPRYSRNDEAINKLAQRISRNGFEITRAVWATKNDNGYEVFAGGTRLEAAKRAGCKNIPIILHEGLTEDDIVKLADQDNENDEYHEKVNPVDVWANYAWLDKQGWTQDRIGKAKGVSQAMVSYRLNLHKMPDKVKDFISQELLTEGHLTEIMQLSVDLYFAPWLTSEQAWLELTEKAVYDKGKNGSKAVKAVKADVKTWQTFIDEANQIYNNLSDTVTLYDLSSNPPMPYQFNAKSTFIEELVSRKARSLNEVKAAGRTIQLAIKQNLENYETYIKKESFEAAQKAIKAETEAKLLEKFILGDCLETLDNWQYGSIRLLLIDPPYGKDYQSNRRWATKTPDKITGDGEKAIELLGQALIGVVPHLLNEAHTLIFCDWEKEPEVRRVISKAGLKIKGSLIWAKEEHSAGDIKGAFGPSHERIIHAVKGSPEVTPRKRDVLDCSRSHETNHPNEKPVDLLKTLIQSTTNEGDLVVDLFAGSGSTLIAAMRLNREFIGVEIDQTHHTEGCNRLLKELDNE